MNIGLDVIRYSGILLFLTLSIALSGTELYHHRITSSNCAANTLTWSKQQIIPFQEILVSWSGKRPQAGTITFSISVHARGTWSPWFPYARWEKLEQHMYKLQANRDITAFRGGTKATGFRIRVETKQGASLRSLRALHVSVTDFSKHRLSTRLPTASSRTLAVTQVSQIALAHADNERICSPTSTSSVVSYLLGDSTDPLTFAKDTYESLLHIYGTWTLNTAQASHELGAPWYCYVSRCSHLQQIINQLDAKCPVVVSIQGPIPGGARPYQSGHLLVVRGYDAENKKILCMDPAFPTDQETYISYDVHDFLKAWKRRNGLTYFFTKTLKQSHSFTK